MFKRISKLISVHFFALLLFNSVNYNAGAQYITNNNKFINQIDSIEYLNNIGAKKIATAIFPFLLILFA